MHTVLAHGCFDHLHLGHIRHLKEARQLGERLVVSVTADRHIRKGEWRPQFSAEQRREALLSLDCVDEVIITDEPTAAGVIARVRPAVYVKGADYADSDDAALIAERTAVEQVGGRLHITSSYKWSSTELLRSVRLSTEALGYIEYARNLDFLPDILSAFDRADAQRILFVGETIIDEYRYVRPLAKPSKEFVLATQLESSEVFEGGVMAAAKHGEWAKGVAVCTYPAVRKVRYVSADFFRKLFEVYEPIPVERADNGVLEEALRDADVVIAMDFGHGFFDAVARRNLAKARFLALTAQSNAGNQGFNPFTRHGGADYVVVDEPEARLAVGQQSGSIDDLVEGLRQRDLHARCPWGYLTITRGRLGAVATTLISDEITSIPAFVESGRDTMGAGDAFLAVAAPLVAVGLSIEKAAFVGNVAGGLKTSIIGHRQHVTRQDIIKHLEWMLK